MLLRVGEAGNGAGDAARLVADERHIRDYVSLGVEVHVACGSGGGLFAVVDEMGLAAVVADEHEATATDVACCGIDNGEGEADGRGCIDGVAALLQDSEACIGGVMVDGDDHGVLGPGWLLECDWSGRLGCERGCGEDE